MNEADKWAFAEQILKIAIARDAIIRTGKQSGSMTCPICFYGTLRFSVAPSNGHIHAMCVTADDGPREGLESAGLKPTPDCVRFME